MSAPPAGYYAPAGSRPIPPRRRRRWPLRLAVVLLVLVGLAVAADRIAASIAENVAARSIQDSQQLQQRPDVSIAGFPFLTQFADSRYPNVQITGHDIPVGPAIRQLQLDTVVVHLHDVTTAQNFHVVRAASATAEARASYAELSRTLGLPVAYAGPGRIGGSVTAPLAGRSITGRVSAHVTASTADGLRFTAVRVSAGGLDLPQFDQALGAAFGRPIPLDGLPFQIRVTGLDVTASGLVVHFSGANLSYDGG